jgi:glutamate-5-semialdehyde dehydrogenase
MKQISLKKMAKEAKEASYAMASATTEQKNQVLMLIADMLKSRRNEILAANQIDMHQAKEDGMPESLIDRLSLQGNRLEGVISDLQQVIRLPDPIGELIDHRHNSCKLQIIKCRTPIGVLGIIYESRPNVTVDTCALAIKSGNCAILRGGSEAFNTNSILVKTIKEAISFNNLPADAIQFIPSVDRKQVKALLRLHEFIDLIIPRGGAGLHQFCRENSKIPVITGGMGVCHLFVDETADLDKSIKVIDNAKTQRPTVCNALDTVLVHEAVAEFFIPLMIGELMKKGCQFCLDGQAMKFIPKAQELDCRLALPQDWDTEWYSLNLGIKIVANLNEAIQHIQKHSTGHSDGILTQNQQHADQFVKKVDSAAVYVNSSTRFTDGGQLGLGAEVAISTQKIHARGPMGLQELTSYKWIIKGDYAVRD